MSLFSVNKKTPFWLIVTLLLVLSWSDIKSLNTVDARKMNPKYHFIMEHSFDGGETWSLRGELRSKGSSKALAFHPEHKDGWPSHWITALQETAQSRSPYLVSIRSTADTPSLEPWSRENRVFASLPACHIAASAREALTLHLHTSGTVEAISYHTHDVLSCHGTVDDASPPQLSAAAVAVPQPGPAVMVDPTEMAQAERREREKANEPSFLRKYVCRFVFLFFIVI
eukprot:gb/GECH01006666.1/.p1 GENE.gb/GECH01006666.1/~~gb/GECH01006666.1/.p1  ORF type:complete len:227 (+),score=37.12 gb/GECH01006666.1/:1-681(+)